MPSLLPDDSLRSFNSIGIQIADMVTVTDQLRRTGEEISAGLMSSLEPILDLSDFVSTFTSLFADLGAALKQTYPQNWWGVDNLSEVDFDTLVLKEGLPLAWVVPEHLLKRIIKAETGVQRRRLLYDSRTSITRTCRGELDHVTSRPGREAVYFASAAVSAFESGHVEAAQALAAAQLDSLGLRFFPRWKRQVSKNGRPDLEEMPLSDALVLGGIWGAHLEFRPGDAIPRQFSRHASAHGVSFRQYSKRNALIATMHVVALIRWLEIEGYFQE